MTDKSDHDLLLEIHTTLLGANGQGGLCRDYQATKADYYRFKRNITIVLCSGAGLSAVITGLIELLRKLNSG